MGMVWRRSQQAKVRLEFGRKLPFSADRYSFRPAGFNAKRGIVHPSVGRQRLSEGTSVLRKAGKRIRRSVEIL